MCEQVGEQRRIVGGATWRTVDEACAAVEFDAGGEGWFFDGGRGIGGEFVGEAHAADTGQEQPELVCEYHIDGDPL
ncbi:hypothetical protein [Nocardia bovistercoris]|uniref:Uncharacterized protein n=1 Tax=Nocardia bovistercoris TaxID=2785916 RepID=A0A931IBX7_9NOCA|nr:hypothetical protein [Nocardia bovistercoris]MBH0778797.1 hypothetical protein [Nocardia bovistercoris]